MDRFQFDHFLSPQHFSPNKEALIVKSNMVLQKIQAQHY